MYGTTETVFENRPYYDVIERLTERPEHENVVVLEDEVLPRHPPRERARLPHVNTLVPVGQHVPRELCAQVDDAEAEVRVVEGQVVRDGPHHDQVHVLVAQLPSRDLRERGGEYSNCHMNFRVFNRPKLNL